MVKRVIPMFDRCEEPSSKGDFGEHRDPIYTVDDRQTGMDYICPRSIILSYKRTNQD